MIDIYKKLPGTNCGKCGVQTCMAFALKVKKGQAGLGDCPFVSAGASEEAQIGPSAGAFSSYEQVSIELEKEACRTDFSEAAEAAGGGYKTEGGEAISVKMLTRDYEMRRDGLFIGGECCRDAWTKIIICDYIQKQGRKPLTGELIALGHFPHTASHVKAFQSNAEKKLAEFFGNDLDGLKRRCAEMGGVQVETGTGADFTCRIDLLPRVPLYLSFWKADEEFAPDCKILFDSGAEDHLDIEYLAYLLELFVKEMTGEE
jgi:hypothetical protein